MSIDRSRTPEDVRAELVYRMQTEGAQVAYETALAICNNPKASPTAQASALKALLFVGGYHGKDEAERDRPLSEWTADELRRETDAIMRRRRQVPSEDQDVFG